METQNIINIVLVALCVFAIGLAVFGMGKATITGAQIGNFDVDQEIGAFSFLPPNFLSNHNFLIVTQDPAATGFTAIDGKGIQTQATYTAVPPLYGSVENTNLAPACYDLTITNYVVGVDSFGDAGWDEANSGINWQTPNSFELETGLPITGYADGTFQIVTPSTPFTTLAGGLFPIIVGQVNNPGLAYNWFNFVTPNNGFLVQGKNPSATVTVTAALDETCLL